MDFKDFLNKGKQLDIKQAKLDAEMEAFTADKKASNRKTTPFEFIESIQTKNYLFQERNAKHYVPFVVNMGLSQHVQNIGYVFEATILQANLSGLHIEFANQLQYDYLFHSIRKGKQFSKWAKVEQYDNLELIQETYKVNRDEGIKILAMLSDEDIQKLIEHTNNKAGGLQHPVSKRKSKKS